MSSDSDNIPIYIQRFVYDVMKLRGQVVKSNDNFEKKQQIIKLLYKTLNYYTENKQKILGESFDFPLIIKFQDSDDEDVNQNNKQKSEEYNEETSSSDYESDELSSEHSSETDSEYVFSDVDEEETITVNKTMANAMIKLKRYRQSKNGIYINKITDYN